MFTHFTLQQSQHQSLQLVVDILRVRMSGEGLGREAVCLLVVLLHWIVSALNNRKRIERSSRGHEIVGVCVV